MTEAAPRLSLVLACYNEGEHLEGSFQEIKEVLDDLHVPYEVLFVDDMSRDGTREIIAAIARTHADADIRVLLHERNQGRGATVRDGFRAARGEVAGFLDVDLEVHARYIPSLLKAIEKGADVATVRRIYAFQLRSIVRYILSRGYGWLQRRLLATRVRDTETGYKFFRREALRPLLDEAQDPGWFWDTEIMICAERRGLKIAEIPGAFVRRDDKTSTVRDVHDSWEYLRKLWSFSRRRPA